MCACQYGRVFQSRVCCARIQCLRMYGPLKLEQHHPVNNCSFFEGTIWPTLGIVLNGMYICCTFSYPCLLIPRKFSYMPCVAVPLSIMVSTTGFISSLLASIHEDSMVFVKDLLEIGKNSISTTKITSFFHVFVNFEIFKQCYFVKA